MLNGQQRAAVPVYAPWMDLQATTARASIPRSCSGFSSEVHLLGLYSNHDLQAALGRLAKKLAAVRAKGGPRRPLTSCRQRSRRPGWVLDAIVRVLTDRGEPMRAKDIHTAVEALVGERVPLPSVKGALAKHVTGSSARFVRVARGRYALA
jgi:hypothetical protein